MRPPCIFCKGRPWHWLTALMISVVLLWGAYAPSLALGEVKTRLSMGTDKKESLFNALGNGYAKVISQYSKTTVVVRPFTGPEAWLPALDKGEIELGSISAGNTWYPYNAVGPLYSIPLRNLRLLRAVKEVAFMGFVVPNSSSIKTVEDLKGKRVPGGFVGNTPTLNTITGALEAGGLTWADVVQVPVPDLAGIMRAFGEGRADVGWSPAGMPILREIDLKMGGIRFLPFKLDAKTLEIIRRIIAPVLDVGIANKGLSPGILEDTPLITYDSYLIAWAGLDDETATLIVSTLWDRTEELFPVHPGFKGFTRDAAVTSRPVIPYHPAAIRFYKEKGAWKEEAERIVK